MVIVSIAVSSLLRVGLASALIIVMNIVQVMHPSLFAALSSFIVFVVARLPTLLIFMFYSVSEIPIDFPRARPKPKS